MVDAVSDAKRRAWLDRMRAYTRRLLLGEFVRSRYSPVGLPTHRRENGPENLKMAVFLEFWHFQPAA
jgi:hypothetical protein